MPSMTIEEMDAAHDKLQAVAEAVTVDASVVVDADSEDSDEFSGLDLYNSLLEAVDLMKRCSVFFDFAADKVLTTNLTNGHRNLMKRLSYNICEFTEAAEAGLAEMEEEE